MTHVHVWLEDEGSPESGDILLLWSQRRFEAPQFQRIVSIPEEVERDKDAFRSRYVRWIRRISEDLNMASSGSARTSELVPDTYWWFTLPTLPAFTVDSVPYAVVRTWALVDLLDDANPSIVEITGRDTNVSRILQSWCLANGVTFIWNRDNPGDNGSWLATALTRLRNSSSAFVNISLGLLFLFRSVVRYMRIVDQAPPSPSRPSFVLVDYIDGLKLDPDSHLSCKSMYWNDLPDRMIEWGIPFAWVHIDVPSTGARRVRDRRSFVTQLNHASSEANHRLLQDGHGVTTWWRVFRTYAAIARRSPRCPGTLGWTDRESRTDLSPILERHWASATRGLLAAQNAVWIVLTSKTARDFAQHSTALYLMENQPWEMALIAAWRREGSHKVDGVIHSTVRMWDTRYWLPLMQGKTVEPAPQPDSLLTNGPQARRNLAAGGYEADRMVAVEALRFGAQEVSDDPSDETRDERKTTRLLVLGEYDRALVARQIRLCRNFADHVRDLGIVLRFRAHPSTPVNQEQLGSGISLSTHTFVADDLRDTDWVLAGSLSSAIIDAALAQVPVLLVPDDRYFNGSPLEDDIGQHVVTNCDDAVAGLERLQLATKSGSRIEALSILDIDASRRNWRAFLECG